LKAGFIAEELGLHFSDALIYSFATKERKVVTGDDHFKKFENVEFIE
jgi:predicted nucleic acid-binding protein